MNREVFITVAAIIFIIVSLVLLYKYKREYLKVIAYYAVIQAEDLYSNGHGKEKLMFAIQEVKQKLPWYLSWLISEKAIAGVIESVLSTLQTQFKSAKDDKIRNLDTLINVGVSTGNVTEVVKTAEHLKNGYIEGYAQAQTDFRGNSSGAAGVRAGYKF